MFDLRYYQNKAIDDFFSYAEINFTKNPLIVLPTGAGKSIICAHIIDHIYKFPGTRILVVTHTKDIIQQNYNEFLDYTEENFVDAGIYSAGLKKKDTHHRVIFAGIQSVFKKAMHLGFFDILIIDEAHCIPKDSDGMYRSFIAEMRKINHKIMIVGLTATPYRMKGGLLIDGEGAIFDDVCHETTMTELMDANHPDNLDKKQYLSTLVSPSKAMKFHADLSQVHTRMGEFVEKEMEAEFMKDEILVSSIKEMIEYVQVYNRKKILIFTSGIEHAEAVKKILEEIGEKAGIVHSQRTDIENDIDKGSFVEGKINYLVNVNSLTTGYNVKAIDCIVLLRGIQSPGLIVQIAGRGTRICDGKENCLLLDFGGNLERFGPIDKIRVKRKQGGGLEIDGMPQKTCPGLIGNDECRMLLHISVMKCPNCGYEFPQKPKHDDEASQLKAVSSYEPPKRYEVEDVMYFKHEKIGKTPSMRVDYFVDISTKFSNWVCIDHSGFAKTKALEWLAQVTKDNFDSVDEALEYSQYFRKPDAIVVDENGEFPRIMSYIFSKPIPEPEKEKRLRESKEKMDQAIESLVGW